MAELSPKEELPPPKFLRKLIPQVPFQMPHCPPIVDTILREKLGILSPKEIYIPGPEHDNCTLQTDKYYTQVKQKIKEIDGKKKVEEDGHGTHGDRDREKCASHGHRPCTQGQSRNSANPVGSPLMRSEEVGYLRNSHAHCGKRPAFASFPKNSFKSYL